MIQRIQSIYLFIVFLLHLIIFHFQYFAATDGIGLYISKYIESGITTQTLLISIFNYLLIVSSLAIIFLFRNRRRQILFTQILIGLEVLLLILMLVNGNSHFDHNGKLSFFESLRPALLIPIIAIILLFMATSRIKHDENLVRSADRLR